MDKIKEKFLIKNRINQVNFIQFFAHNYITLLLIMQEVSIFLIKALHQ